MKKPLLHLSFNLLIGGIILTSSLKHVTADTVQHSSCQDFPTQGSPDGGGGTKDNLGYTDTCMINSSGNATTKSSCSTSATCYVYQNPPVEDNYCVACPIDCSTCSGTDVPVQQSQGTCAWGDGGGGQCFCKFANSVNTKPVWTSGNLLQCNP